MVPNPAVLFEIRKVLPASLRAVERIAVEIRETLKALPVPACSKLDIFASELLCREALVNAVRHGCALDNRRHVGFAARVRADRVTLAITDDGPGFDWQTPLSREPGDCDTCGRGMAIYQGYADKIRFSARGNRLTMVRRFTPGGIVPVNGQTKGHDNRGKQV